MKFLTDIDDIAFDQLSFVWNPMADDLIHGPGRRVCVIIVREVHTIQNNVRANGFGERAVVQRGRIAVSLYCRIVDDLVYFVGRDPRFDSSCTYVKDFTS